MMWIITHLGTIVYELLLNISGNSVSKMNTDVTRIKFLISAFDCKKLQRNGSTN